MLLKRKHRFKPFYKQITKLYNYFHNPNKILKFKKQKWIKTQKNIEYKNKFYQIRKLYGQLNYEVSKYPNRWASYQKGGYRNLLLSCKKIKLFYGKLNQKKIKKLIHKTYSIHHHNHNIDQPLKLTFIKLMESRLDFILYRAKFVNSVRTARQLIRHKKVLVNFTKITYPDFLLKSGDIVSVIPEMNNVIARNIVCSLIKWPLPPKHLIINYNTLQIMLINLKNENVSAYFNINLKLEKLLLDFHKIK